MRQRQTGTGSAGQPANSGPTVVVVVISPGTAGLKGLAASGLVAIPPNSHADLQWAMVGIRAATSQPRDRQTGTNKNYKKKTFQNEKTKWCEGAPLTVWSGLLSWCTQREEHGDEE